MPEDTTLGLITLEYGNAETVAGTTAWTSVGKVTECEPPAPEADDIETSNMDHTDRIKRFRAGWIDPGQLEVTRQYDKTQHAGLIGLLRVKRAWRITLEDGSTIEVDESYVKSIGTPTDREGIVTEPFTIKVSGPVTFVPAA